MKKTCTYCFLIFSIMIQVAGCTKSQQSNSTQEPNKESDRRYVELARFAAQENDLVKIATTKDPSLDSIIVEVLLESEIAAFFEGSVIYSIEVRRQQANLARQIINQDARLKNLDISVLTQTD